MPTALRSILEMVHKSRPLLDALLVSPATLNPGWALYEGELCLLYFPNVPRGRRMQDVRIKLIKMPFKTWLVEDSWKMEFVVVENISVWRGLKQDRRMYGRGRILEKKAPRR